MKKRVVCVIPARLMSTRFPRKVLCTIKGVPLLKRVWDGAKRVPLFNEVLFAVDAEETAELIEGFGGTWVMTSKECASGSDRLAELLKKGRVEGDIWVNWQADEPLIHEHMIRDLLQSCETEESDLWTLKKRITEERELANPHIAKVVCDKEGFALYFSRSQIPHYRDEPSFLNKIVYKHVGLYAYTREALLKISELPPCDLERAEQLEQLRFLYHRLRIRVHETEHEVFGIDLPEHVQMIEKNFKNC